MGPHRAPRLGRGQSPPGQELSETAYLCRHFHSPPEPVTEPMEAGRSRRDHALEAMETFVLIPKELSLVLCEKESGTSSAMLPQHQAPSENVRKEASAAVWSNSRITRGTRFLPFQGTVRLDKLDVFGTLDRNDV
ncbi:unnamed protein product, partial [Ixodes persulcatus]